VTGVIVPAYLYPSSPAVWKPVITAKQAYPSVPFVDIANPASGPGSASDPNYVTAIKSLQAVGIKVVGYVDTAYGQRTAAAVEADMASWLLWYSVDGFFFDDVATTGAESYLRALKSYAPTKLCIGNPGTAVPLDYVGILDSLVLYEGPGFPPSGEGVPGATAICYAVPAFAAPPVGGDYVFLTDQPEATAYSVMSPYLVQLASALSVPASRPQAAEWVGFYRAGGKPLHVVNGSVWLESVGLPFVNDNGPGKGDGYSSLMLNCIPNDGSGLLYQNVLQFSPSYVNWVVQVVYGAKALHTFPVQLQGLAAGSFGQWLIDFQYNDGIMSIEVIDIDNGQTIYGGSHSLPGNYVRDPAEGKVWPNAPIMNAYLAAGGYGNGSSATYQPGTVLKCEYFSDADVTDLAFAMFNGETPPGGMNSIGEFANLYAAFPFVAAPDQISFLMQTLTPDIAPTW